MNVVSTQPGEITLRPIDDAYVDYWNLDTNFGNATELKVAFSSGCIYLTYLKFDLSSLPRGIIGADAVVELYTNQHQIPETHDVTAHFGFDNSWSEDTLTGENDAGFNWTGILDMEPVANVERLYVWIVTEAVLEAFARNQTELTIVLKHVDVGHDGAMWVEFYSKEYGKKMPELTISWTDIPEFPSPIILPFFMLATLLAALVYRRKITKSSRVKMLYSYCVP